MCVGEFTCVSECMLVREYVSEFVLGERVCVSLSVRVCACVSVCVENVPQVEVDGADIRDQLLGFEVKLAEVLHLQGPHLWPHQVLQEVVQHGNDPLSQEWEDEDPLDLWRERRNKDG